MLKEIDSDYTRDKNKKKDKEFISDLNRFYATFSKIDGVVDTEIKEFKDSSFKGIEIVLKNGLTLRVYPWVTQDRFFDTLFSYEAYDSSGHELFSAKYGFLPDSGPRILPSSLTKATHFHPPPTSTISF